MGLGLAFWILMLLWVVLGVLGTRVDTSTPNGRWLVWGGDVLLFFLFLLLGWQEFGAPLKG